MSDKICGHTWGTYVCTGSPHASGEHVDDRYGFTWKYDVGTPAVQAAIGELWGGALFVLGFALAVAWSFVIGVAICWATAGAVGWAIDVLRGL